MNPLTNVKNITKINEIELEKGLIDKKSWHDMYKDSAWIFIGGLAYGLTEGDIIAVFSQYGEIVNINMVRDKKTGKTKGFCFLCYTNQKSTVLAVDNFNGIKLCNRTIRVDHVANYKPPKEDERDDEMTKTLKSEGCAPKPLISQLVGGATEKHEKEKKKKLKKEKKEKKKKKNIPEIKEYPNLSKVKIEKEDSGYDKYDTINSGYDKHDSRQKKRSEKHESIDKRRDILHEASKNSDYGRERKLEKKYLEDSEGQKDEKYRRKEAELQSDRRRSHSNDYKSRSENEDRYAYNRDRESWKQLKHSSASNSLHSRDIDKYPRDRRDEHFEKISRETVKNHSYKKLKYDSSEENCRDLNKECSYNIKSKSRKKEKDSCSSSSSSSSYSSSSSSSDSDTDSTHRESQKSFSKCNSSEKRTERRYDERKEPKSSRLCDEEKDNNRFRDKHLSRSERDRISHLQRHKRTYDKYDDVEKHLKRKK